MTLDGARYGSDRIEMGNWKNQNEKVECLIRYSDCQHYEYLTCFNVSGSVSLFSINMFANCDKYMK